MNLCKYSAIIFVGLVALCLSFGQGQSVEQELEFDPADEMEMATNYLILGNIRRLLDLQQRLVGQETNRVSVRPRSLTLTDLIIKNKKSSSLPQNFVQFLKDPQNRQKFELIQKLFEQEVENYRQIQRMIYSYGR